MMDCNLQLKIVAVKRCIGFTNNSSCFVSVYLVSFSSFNGHYLRDLYCTMAEKMEIFKEIWSTRKIISIQQQLIKRIHNFVSNGRDIIMVATTAANWLCNIVLHIKLEILEKGSVYVTVKNVNPKKVGACLTCRHQRELPYMLKVFREFGFFSSKIRKILLDWSWNQLFLVHFNWNAPEIHAFKHITKL